MRLIASSEDRLDARLAWTMRTRFPSICSITIWSICTLLLAVDTSTIPGMDDISFCTFPAVLSSSLRLLPSNFICIGLAFPVSTKGISSTLYVIPDNLESFPRISS